MTASAIPGQLLEWYDRNARTLPWRVPPEAGKRGGAADPYRVWLSEVMLQQTTTAHAAPYFKAFTERWPTVEALAAAAEEDVMAAWAGLGYYSRARNLIACARAVAFGFTTVTRWPAFATCSASPLMMSAPWPTCVVPCSCSRAAS